ncbi:hypothetical protein AB833_07315 [Chromatiales bacterium (ex Bugula neritina AB1)]|nr:hypothetical protein AB833_07315 [Chromatiales bacterium (ex Bugula neritina AB1)]
MNFNINPEYFTQVGCNGGNNISSLVSALRNANRNCQPSVNAFRGNCSAKPRQQPTCQTTTPTCRPIPGNCGNQPKPQCGGTSTQQSSNNTMPFQFNFTNLNSGNNAQGNVSYTNSNQNTKTTSNQGSVNSNTSTTTTNTHTVQTQGSSNTGNGYSPTQTNGHGGGSVNGGGQGGGSVNGGGQGGGSVHGGGQGGGSVHGGGQGGGSVNGGGQGYTVRSLDGTGNNLLEKNSGAANTEFTRLVPQDKTRAPDTETGKALPNARDISNAVFAENGDPKLDPNGTSNILWQWGQFNDHDITATAKPDTRAGEPGEKAPISVPTGDRALDPFATGTQEIPFTRSTATVDSNGNKQQTNLVSAYIDGSQVYGSDAETAADLRTFDGGRLKMSDGNLLPLDEKGFFKAGDDRVNEQPGLTSMHTLFAREHNRLADEYRNANPQWSDSQIYEAARSKNIAQMQSITYNEYLPALLGRDAISEYAGYDPTADATLSNEFSTAAYRFGHSMISGEVAGTSLADAFMNPEIIKENGIEGILASQASTTGQALDHQIVDEVRNMLFGPPGAGGQDLAALNIQRGRDHELASYNDTREALGLHRITSFDDPIFADGVGEKLASVYDNVDQVDLWVGGLAEDQHGDSMMGELFTSINTDQYENIRNADRFWYENTYSGAELQQLQQTTLADIIERNSSLDMQDNVFYNSAHFA